MWLDELPFIKEFIHRRFSGIMELKALKPFSILISGTLNRRSASPKDFIHDPRRAEALGNRDEHDLASVLFDHVATDDILQPVVGPFYQYIGP